MNCGKDEAAIQRRIAMRMSRKARKRHIHRRVDVAFVQEVNNSNTSRVRAVRRTGCWYAQSKMGES